MTPAERLTWMERAKIKYQGKADDQRNAWHHQQRMGNGPHYYALSNFREKWLYSVPSREFIIATKATLRK